MHASFVNLDTLSAPEVFVPHQSLADSHVAELVSALHPPIPDSADVCCGWWCTDNAAWVSVRQQFVPHVRAISMVSGCEDSLIQAQERGMRVLYVRLPQTKHAPFKGP